jgi:hypothetical protein
MFMTFMTFMVTVMRLSVHSGAMAMLFVGIAVTVVFFAKSSVYGSERRRNDGSGGICGNAYNSPRYLKWRFNHCDRRVYRNPDHCTNAAGQCTDQSASSC